MNAVDASSLRKRLIADSHAHRVNDSGHIDLAACATVAYSSEDPGHPIENLLDGQRGTRWMSARQNSTEQIVIEFDTPQSISRIVYEVEEPHVERTQEVRLEVSYDAGHTYRQLRVQEYSFSPRGATFQHEDMRLNVERVTHLRLTVVPNKNGSGAATLTTLRLYA
jgi:hypothetical protein